MGFVGSEDDQLRGTLVTAAAELLIRGPGRRDQTLLERSQQVSESSLITSTVNLITKLRQVHDGASPWGRPMRRNQLEFP